MTYSELHSLIVEKYQTLTSLNNKLLTLLIQKNKIDIELNVLQLQRQSLTDEIKEIEQNSLDEFKTYLKNIEIPIKEKKLKDKTNISMQPTITHDDELEN